MPYCLGADLQVCSTCSFSVCQRKCLVIKIIFIQLFCAVLCNAELFPRLHFATTIHILLTDIPSSEFRLIPWSGEDKLLNCPALSVEIVSLFHKLSLVFQIDIYYFFCKYTSNTFCHIVTQMKNRNSNPQAMTWERQYVRRKQPLIRLCISSLC